jgi:hypothetical protein
MPNDYPDAAPSQGWPASHARRLDALEKSLPVSIFAATLLGTSLPHYVPKEVLDQVRDLAAQYPGPSSVVGLLAFLSVAKIPPPPPESPLMPLWKWWAKYSPTFWDRWFGLKVPGRIDPPLPAPVPVPADEDPRGQSAPPTPRNSGESP